LGACNVCSLYAVLKACMTCHSFSWTHPRRQAWVETDGEYLNGLYETLTELTASMCHQNHVLCFEEKRW